jgi:hypothetical protein
MIVVRLKGGKKEVHRHVIVSRKCAFPPRKESGNPVQKVTPSPDHLLYTSEKVLRLIFYEKPFYYF